MNEISPTANAPSFQTHVCVEGALALAELIWGESGDLAAWRGSEPPSGPGLFPAMRHLLEAGVMKHDDQAGQDDDLFFCLWVSRADGDENALQFVFEGAADADLSAIMAIELLIGDHRIEAPVERLSDRQIKAVCFAPMEMVIDRARRVVNSPIRLRALTA